MVKKIRVVLEMGLFNRKRALDNSNREILLRDLNQAKAEVAQLKQVINKKTDELSERGVEVFTKKWELEKSAIEIKRLTSDLDQCKAEVAQLKLDIDKRDAELLKQDAMISRLESILEHHKDNLDNLLKSNLHSMPWLAGMMADFLTYDIEVEAKKLDWGHNIQREKKVANIRLIRAEAQRRIEEAKEATYQLEYLRQLFPGIDDILIEDYSELQLTGDIPDHDPILDYISKEEWKQLSEDEKNQLALDRYVASKKKSNWQIGRDYELAVGYEYSRKGYKVETYGSYMGLEDLGRDLIATSDDTTLIIQCKYWGQNKTIHEKHIYQLYGTTIGYCIEKGIEPSNIKPVFITNIVLSDMAKKVADYLGVFFVERHKMVDFPRIKCNIGRNEDGQWTKIYHLPMDAQYDKTKIENAGEFYAFTVKEAVDAGFRRAYKWHGSEFS